MQPHTSLEPIPSSSWPTWSPKCFLERRDDQIQQTQTRSVCVFSTLQFASHTLYPRPTALWFQEEAAGAGKPPPSIKPPTGTYCPKTASREANADPFMLILQRHLFLEKESCRTPPTLRFPCSIIISGIHTGFVPYLCVHRRGKSSKVAKSLAQFNLTCCRYSHSSRHWNQVRYYRTGTSQHPRGGSLTKPHPRSLIYVQVSVWFSLVSHPHPSHCGCFASFTKLEVERWWRYWSIRCDVRRQDVLYRIVQDFVTRWTLDVRCGNIDLIRSVA